jgi:hypothetical protein
MPEGDMENLGLSHCLPVDMNAYLTEPEQGRDRRTLMNLTTFFLVS